MKSDNWPIEIDGKKFKIERTFSNEPAIYEFVGDKGENKIRHINGVQVSNLITEAAGLCKEKKSVIIVARIAD